MNCWKKLFKEIRSRFADDDEMAFKHMSEPLGTIMRECKAELVKNNFVLSADSGSLLAPSLDKRLAFAEELVTKIDGDMPVSAILATTYWMQAEMINLNKQ